MVVGDGGRNLGIDGSWTTVVVEVVMAGIDEEKGSGLF